MSVLSISNDPSNSQMEGTQISQLLLQTFPRSPVLPIYSQDAAPAIKIQLLKKLGTFLVSVIHQHWRQDPASTTIIPPTTEETKATKRNGKYGISIHFCLLIYFLLSTRSTRALIPKFPLLTDSLLHYRKCLV